MRPASGHRSPEEDKARGRCREIVRGEGSYLRRTEDRRFVIVAECSRWPEGLLLEFNGWVDVQQRLENQR